MEGSHISVIPWEIYVSYNSGPVSCWIEGIESIYQAAVVVGKTIWWIFTKWVYMAPLARYDNLLWMFPLVFLQPLLKLAIE